MVLSKFSELIEAENGYVYLFSCFSLKWIQLDGQLAKILVQYKDNIEKLEQVHSEFYKALKSEGFIVENNIEESNRAFKVILEKYNSTHNLVITINPTLDCNLRCWYCYEKRHNKSYMSNSTVNSTIKYITSKLTNNRVESLRLSFFGGEPLMYFNQVVYPIISEISDLCHKLCVDLYISFTTNGLLLNENVLASLLRRELKDVSFQIAFDGNRAIHDGIKFFTGSSSSCYDITIKNAKKAISIGYNVVLRCNYSKKTILSFIDVIRDFKDYLSSENVRFLFQRIWQEQEDSEMMDLRRRFISEAETEFSFKSNLHELLGNSLRRCYADYKNNIIINYDGLVFRCTARDFCSENSIGYLTDDGHIFFNKEKDGFNNCGYGKKCMCCRILPICPNCSQIRLEYGLNACPIQIDEDGMIRNIRAAFQDLSGIKLSE